MMAGDRLMPLGQRSPERHGARYREQFRAPKLRETQLMAAATHKVPESRS
jgi:hypothetical protein